MKYEFHTQFSLQECVNQLQEAIDNQPDPSLFFYKTLYGRVDQQGFSLRLARGWKDFYSPIFQGEFIATSNQTILRGGFRLSNGAKVILIVWCLFWFVHLCVFPPILAVFITSSVASMGESLQMPADELYQFLASLAGYACLSLLTALAVTGGLFLYLRHHHKTHQEKIFSLLSDILGAQEQQVA
jgi:hypothetical protein